MKDMSKTRKIVLFLIRFYQRYLSFDCGFFKRLFLTGKTCRFTPSCSEYFYQAVFRYGIITGSLKGVKRVIKCNPWNDGGDDPLK